MLINNTPRRQQLFWIDGNNTPRDWGHLEPFSRRMVETWSPAYWLVYDPATKEKTIYRVNDLAVFAVIEDRPAGGVTSAAGTGGAVAPSR